MWLGSTHEVAQLLGVSKARVYQLRKAGIIIEPLDSLACGPIWDMQAVAKWLETWPRRPGNPHKVRRRRADPPS